MARGVAYVVFVIPVVFTVVFSSAVLTSALDSLDRELNMWPAASHSQTSSIIIMGLQEEYLKGGIVEFQLHIQDGALDCGDVTVLIYNLVGDAVTEEFGQFQCVPDGPQHLILDGFSTSGVEPGSYTITTMVNDHGNQLISSAVFYIR